MKASRGFARTTFCSPFLTRAFFMRTSPLPRSQTQFALRPMHLHSKHLFFFCFIRSLINYDQFNIDLPQNLLFSQMFIRLIDRHHGFEFQFCSSKKRRKTLFPFFSFLSSFFSILLLSTRFQSVDFNQNEKFCFAPRRRNKFRSSVNSLLSDRPLFVVAFHSPRTIYRWPLNHFPANN